MLQSRTCSRRHRRQRCYLRCCLLAHMWRRSDTDAPCTRCTVRRRMVAQTPAGKCSESRGLSLRHCTGRYRCRLCLVRMDSNGHRSGSSARRVWTHCGTERRKDSCSCMLESALRGNGKNRLHHSAAISLENLQSESTSWFKLQRQVAVTSFSSSPMGTGTHKPSSHDRL